MPLNAETDASAHISQTIMAHNRESRDETSELAGAIVALLENKTLHIGAVALAMATAAFSRVLTEHAHDIAVAQGDDDVTAVPSADAHALAVFFITRQCIASRDRIEAAVEEKQEALSNGTQLS